MSASPVRVTAATLKGWMDTEPASIAIVDVRDSDYVGGHIKASVNVPSGSFYSQMADLRTRLANASKVVFHCQLSQQRGPTCAKAYHRHISSNCDSPQEIYVLTGGFSEWARLYGKDSKYTEGFVSDLYE